MSTTTKDTRNEKILQVVTEVDDEAVNSRKRLKGMFLDKDKMQMSSYIKDLEKSLSINKGIIADLISTDKDDNAYKKTVEKLNLENEVLHTQLKKAIKQRDDNQARLLICDQIVEELKGHEKDLEQQYMEKSEDLLDQLNRKEYVLQIFEKRYHKSIVLLKKYSDKDAEIRSLMKEFNGKESEQKCITNVLEENEALTTEVKVAREKVAQLGYKFKELKHEALKGLDNNKLLSPARRTPLKMKECSPGSLTSRDDCGGAAATTKALNELISQLQVDKEIIVEEMRTLQEKDEGLNKMNAELSKRLEETQEELRILKNGGTHKRLLTQCLTDIFSGRKSDLNRD